MLRRGSLAFRVLLLHTVALTITAVILPLILVWLLGREVDRLHEQTMRRQAEVVAQHIAPDADGHLTLDLPQDLRDLYSAAYGRYAYAIIDASGKVLFSSNGSATPLLPLPRKNSATTSAPLPGKDIFTGDGITRTIGGHVLTIQVAEDLSHRDVITDDIVADFFRTVGWITLPTLLLLLAIDIVIFRRAMRPLVDASERAAAIGPARAGIRLPAVGIPREVQPLVAAVNQAFDRLEHGYREQRRFTADAAHELRTPLAILNARIETLGAAQDNKDLRRNIETMSRIVAQLLDVAELDGMRIDPSEVVDLSQIAVEIIEQMAPVALDAGKDIELIGGESPAEVHAHAEMVRRAMRNLVENAVRHTAAGTAVTIEVGRDGSISIRDHGPGIAPIDRAAVFQRFWRGDRTRSDGAGLGLSIVKTVMDEHDGAIEIGDAPGGGAIFTMRFRATHPPALASDPAAAT
ncbi:cell wall metabolism sensor histidine kinase WalK [Rhodopseudomonas sp. B29]|uniref:sensor histidine kinase n=1 Tax=Rhodopseudomonas sp. B29 TaxID=95607 RepID=UPI00034C0D76|nr:ATP-binding protein [Rhodopseudomonas sp. B29]